MAGLASYLWLLDDDLRAAPVAETLRLIRATARTGAGTHAILDAYAAVLALDARSHGTAVRRAILDVTGDGVFDPLDLDEFVTAYGLNNPNTPTIPAAPDYSRFDLNGDGFTGGVIVDRVDLDANGLDATGAPIISTVSQPIEGIDITMNEAAVSDLQVLCYYAYSPLYASDQGGPNDQARTRVLGPDRCIELRLSAQLPAQIATSAALTVDVQKVGANGQLAPAENLLVDFTPTCATVNPTSGRTNSNGIVSTTVTPAAGCTAVSVAAVARANPGTAPLGSGTATANVTVTQTCTGADTKNLHVFVADPILTRPSDSPTAATLSDNLQTADTSVSVSVGYGSATISGQSSALHALDSSGNGTHDGGVQGSVQFNDEFIVIPADPALLGQPADITISFKITATPFVTGDRAAIRWGVSVPFPWQSSAFGVQSTVQGRSGGDPFGATYAFEPNPAGFSYTPFGAPIGISLSLFSTVGFECDGVCDALDEGMTGSGSTNVSLQWLGMSVKDAAGNPVAATICSASGTSY